MGNHRHKPRRTAAAISGRGAGSAMNAAFRVAPTAALTFVPKRTEPLGGNADHRPSATGRRWRSPLLTVGIILAVVEVCGLCGALGAAHLRAAAKADA
jgi:hypothetical protein